jgi:hypothetical protein
LIEEYRIGNGPTKVNIKFDYVVVESCIINTIFQDKSVFEWEFLNLIPLTNDEGQGFNTIVLLDFSNSEWETRTLLDNEYSIETLFEN